MFQFCERSGKEGLCAGLELEHSPGCLRQGNVSAGDNRKGLSGFFLNLSWPLMPSSVSGVIVLERKCLFLWNNWQTLASFDWDTVWGTQDSMLMAKARDS